MSSDMAALALSWAILTLSEEDMVDQPGEWGNGGMGEWGLGEWISEDWRSGERNKKIVECC